MVMPRITSTVTEPGNHTLGTVRMVGHASFVGAASKPTCMKCTHTTYVVERNSMLILIWALAGVLAAGSVVTIVTQLPPPAIHGPYATFSTNLDTAYDYYQDRNCGGHGTLRVFTIVRTETTAKVRIECADGRVLEGDVP
jgi:hypothetical protein